MKKLFNNRGAKDTTVQPPRVDLQAKLTAFLNTTDIDNKIELLEDYPDLVAFADKQGTPLLCECIRRDPVVDVLLTLAPNLDVRNKDNKTALMLAAEFNETTTIIKLINAGASTDLQDSSGQTALIKALINGNNVQEVTVTFLKAGAKPDIRDMNGQTALMYAARLAYPETTKRLIEAKASLDLRDNLGFTALAHAITGNAKEEKVWPVIKSLIFNGADIQHSVPLKGIDLTPRELAEIEGLEKAVKLLTLIEQKQAALLLKEAQEFHSGTVDSIQVTGRKLILQPPPNKP